MSVTINERETSWREHQETLKRIRSQLGNVPTPHSRKTPNRSPLARGPKRDHNPYGKYRKTTPPQLPRLEANPEDQAKASRNLRGSKYGVVPPVQVSPRRAKKTTDYDSWGEESGSDLEYDDENLDYQPQPYPYPYPVYAYPNAPPPVVYGPPFQGYYPPPPRVIHRKEKKLKAKGEFSTEDRLETYRTRKHRKSRPWEQGGYTYLPDGAKRREVFDPERNDLFGQYKYIYPRETPYSSQEYNVNRRYQDDQNSLLFFHFTHHLVFAENLVEWLISDFLDQLIPDLLIDTFQDINLVCFFVGENITTAQVSNDLLSAVVPRMVRDVVRESLNEMANNYMGYEAETNDPLEEWLTQLVNDAVWDASFDAVRDTVRELAEDHIELMSTVDMLDEMIEEHIDDIWDELVNDAFTDLVAEDIIEEALIIPVIDEDAPEIATEVLDHYDSQIVRRELKEVSHQAGDKLIDSVCMDYLISLISRQGIVWTESDHANKHMDHMIVNLLLEQHFEVKSKRERTVLNRPLKKLHEKVVTDVSLDLLLQQLTASLDEDLADVDEYERDMDIKPTSTLTPLPFFVS
ncbi:hypothetical protein ScPMuIL_002616 [Solemya velum]